MNQRIGSSFLIVALLLSVLLTLSGCASTEAKSARHTGTERGTTASNTMESVERDIRLVVVGVNSAGHALTTLISPAQEDLPKALAAYSATVDTLVKASAVYIENSEKMGVQGRDFFDEWRLQGNKYVNPQIQALSEQRRSDLAAVYAQIAEKSVGVKGSLKSYTMTLREIQTYFSTDLTPKGVVAITPVALRAIADGYALNNSLENVLASISAVRSELSLGGVEKK